MKKTKTEEATLPAFPNVIPFNEMILRGKLSVGGNEQVKTRNRKWNYRGIVLFYTSGRTVYGIVSPRLTKIAEQNKGKLVGVGMLVDVRELTTNEKVALYKKFNPKAKLSDVRSYKIFGMDEREWRVTPQNYGFFFLNVKRFKKSIPFKWPQGAITTAKVPTQLVAKALKEIDYKI